MLYTDIDLITRFMQFVRKETDRCCVKPDHLFLGIVQDNSADMVAKDRQASGIRSGQYTCPDACTVAQARGELHGSAKLTDKDVLEIRSRHTSGELTCKELAFVYDVGISAIHRIVNRRTWSHI
jgi:hypothetical protein